MARETYSELVVEPFTNFIGQVINPGDKVVAVTTGYGHRVSVFTGIFEGVRREKDGKKQIVGSQIGSVPVECNERVYAEDGEHEETVYKGYDRNTYESIYEKTGKRYNLVEKVTYRKSSLQLNRVFKIDTAAADLPDRLV